VRTRLPVAIYRRSSNEFSPADISGLALWLDGADSSTTYTTDAGPVVAVTQPTDITGCAIWLDGDQSVTASVFDATSGGNAVAAGGEIARWEDKSGNGRHFVQAGSTLRPTLTASGRNGRSVVTFDATNDCMASAATQNIAQPATWIFVYKTPSSVASGWALVDSSTDRIHVYSASGSDLRMFTAGGSIVLENNVAADTWRIGTYHFNGASSQGRSNGVQSATGTTGTVAVNGTIHLASNGGATTFRGQMAEAILLTNASLANIARVEAYLAAKWGISGVHVPATATSDPVGYWGDKSGNGRHAVATAGSRPTISATELNGKKQLGLISQHLRGPSATWTGSASIYWVGKTGQAANTAIVFGDGTTDQTDGFHAGWLNTAGVGAYGNGWQSGNAPRAESPSAWRNADIVAGVTLSSTEAIARVNGATTNTTAALTGSLSQSAAAQFYIGRETSGTWNNLNGSLAELLIYQPALSAPQRQRVERYLASKYGITLAPTVSNADAQDWVNRVYANGGTVSSATAAAVNAFCDSVDSNGLRSKMVRVNLMCGSNLNAALVPLYRATSSGGSPLGSTTDENSNFIDAHYAENSGLVGNASNRRLNTGLNRSTLGVTVHAGCFAFSRGTASFRTYFGVEKQATAFDRFYMACSTDPANAVWASNGPSATGQTADTAHAAKDFLLGSVVGVGAGQNTLYINGTSAATTSGIDSTSIVSPIHIFTFFRASDSSYNSTTDARIGGYTFGSSLSAGEALTYSTIWDTFLKATGRR
jgi:hypothetical protein